MNINTTSIKINIYHIFICIIWIILGIISAYIFYRIAPQESANIFGSEIKSPRQPFLDFLQGFFLIYFVSGIIMWTLYWSLFNEHERLKIEKEKSAK